MTYTKRRAMFVFVAAIITGLIVATALIGRKSQVEQFHDEFPLASKADIDAGLYDVPPWDTSIGTDSSALSSQPFTYNAPYRPPDRREYLGPDITKTTRIYPEYEQYPMELEVILPTTVCLVELVSKTGLVVSELEFECRPRSVND